MMIGVAGAQIRLAKDFLAEKNDNPDYQEALHVLVVFANGYKNDTLDTKHVECILSNSSDIYNKIKAEGHPITFHESTDYLKQGYVWVPAYKA